MCSRPPGGGTAPQSPKAGTSLPEVVRPLEWLLGTWRGSGRGAYPTIEGFVYGEEVHFSQVAGKPALVAYVQRSWNPNVPTHPPMHIETGYLRPQPHHRVELLVCDPTGVAQVYEGHADATQKLLELSTTSVALTSSAKEAVPRLRYVFHMEAVGQPMQQHLEGELEKVLPSTSEIPGPVKPDLEKGELSGC